MRQGKESSIAYGDAIVSTETARKGCTGTSTCAGIPIFLLLRRLGSFVCRLGSLVRGEVLVLVPFVPVD
jgi:hypothetical protein